jgi:SAM-dependent methyltransferase
VARIATFRAHCEQERGDVPSLARTLGVAKTMVYNLAMTTPFDPHRFRSSAPYYARYRVPYPDRLIAYVGDHCRVEHGSAVLDLGCGPGPLAIAFARLGARVTAIDPEPTMLAALREGAAAAGVAVTTIEGSSYDLPLSLGPFQLVTLGRAFHWMDRAATVAALDAMIGYGGALAVFGDKRIATPGAEWPALLERMAEEFAPAKAAERRVRKQADEPAEVVLLRSPFASLERHGVIVIRELKPDDIVGRAYSMSTTSPASLEERRGAFESTLRAQLAQLSPTGAFREIVEVNALIAMRPAERETQRH